MTSYFAEDFVEEDYGSIEPYYELRMLTVESTYFEDDFVELEYSTFEETSDYFLEDFADVSFC